MEQEAGRTQQGNTSTICNHAFVVLLFANLFQSMASFIAIATVPLFAADLGASNSMVGVLVGAFAATALGIRPFSGPAFQSFSKKWLLVGALGIICASLVLYGVVDSLQQMFFVRLLHGIGIGCAGPLSMSLVADHLPNEHFASGISIYTVAQALSQAVGPAVGLGLMNAVGFHMTYWIAAVPMAVSIVAVMTLPEKQRPRQPYKLQLGRMFAREAVDAAVVLMLLSAAFSCVGSYIVLYGTKLGVDSIGWYFTVYALCLLATRPFFGRLADQFGAARVLVPGVICFALSFVLLSFAHDLTGFIIVAVVASCGFGACTPLVQSLALQSVGPERRGVASNTSFTGLDLGNLVGPTIGGLVIEALQPTLGSEIAAYSGMWIVMLVPIGLGLLVILRWNRHRPQD